MQLSSDRWLPLKDILISPEGRWESRARFGPFSEWFSGHFDECPLVPGVAILALAAETVKRLARGKGRILEVSGFSRVRFKRLIFPEEELCISISALPAGPEAQLDFYLTCQGEAVVQGVVKVTEPVFPGERNNEQNPSRA